MGKGKGEAYKVGCAHCGELVGEFERPVTQEKINSMPKHHCQYMGELNERTRTLS